MISRFRNLLGLTIMASLLGAEIADSQNSATVTVHADEPGALVSSNLFGAFYEEINYAGEGGLYAEMVRNRDFYDSRKPEFWSLVKQGDATGSMAVDTANPLNSATPNSLRLTLASGAGSVGAGNSGFWGMSLQAGASYNLSLFAKAAAGGANSISVRLESADGSHVYSDVSFEGLTDNWRQFTTPLVSSGTDTNARLVVALSSPGTVWLDIVSLIPKDTFHGRPNGLRLDLASKVADLHPSFLRFPGGNYIESFNVADAVRWKTTIGDISQRPGHFNDSWGYWSTDGLGTYEFFQFCEDAGMEPLYGINAGLMLNYNGSRSNTVPLDQLQPWVQDALDLIEYANGDTNTTWGARRAAAGHPAPFNLKYMEVGNENGGPMFDERYTRFYDAIKAKYPNIHLLAPGNWSGGKPWSRHVEIADEHYYDSPSTFISYATKYDNYDRNGSKIFVGEYAVTSGFGTNGNLAAALGEAAFMTGLERNSDLVVLASYAPLFANLNGIQWHPDMIYYDGSRSFGTPSYYVQQMFSRNRGDMVLPTSVNVPANQPGLIVRGAIGVGSWNTAVEYSNIEVTSNDVPLFKGDFTSQKSPAWRTGEGNWVMSNGRYRQTDSSLEDCSATIGNTNWSNYSITLRARKTGGKEGFIILFHWLDDKNWTWLNVGGWDNTQTAVEQSIGGAKTTLGTPTPQTILPNTWYDIRVVLSGSHIRCYVNGMLVQNVNYPGGLYASSTYAKASGQVIIKAVNPYNSPLATTFKIAGVDSIAPKATVVRLASASPWDENSLAAPEYVFPTTNHIANAGREFSVTLPANSLSIFRLKAAGMHAYTNLSLRLPATINSGQSVQAGVWVQKAGSAKFFNLTTNENHAITYASDNPGIATVDAAGNVTGIAGGNVRITASYASEGISASQTIRMIKVSAQLVHRYSFNETSGLICTDSVGGSAWNGTLPSGGEFNGGQLALSASDSQYVQLPAGILSNYPAVTIDAWVTFPNQLPKDSFFFGFGNTVNRVGANYIFLAPQVGRVAITDASYSREQNANGNFDCSFNSNLHLTAVFNPPEGSISIYTNGVLAGINRDVRIPMTSIRDVCSYLGRSLYSVDPFVDMSLNEFRIYSGALTAREIADEQQLGPDKLLPAREYYSER